MRDKKALIWTIIIGGVLLRLVPHLPNFAPITATALFSGVYLKKRWAILVPLLAMAASDYLLLYIHPFSAQPFDFNKLYPLSALWHATTPYVWGSFAVSGLIGLWLGKHLKPGLVVGASVLTSLQFFIITNFGVWAAGTMYAPTAAGLAQSYIMGLPFLRWTLLGDLFYATAFFGCYAVGSLKPKVVDKHGTIASL